MTTDKLDIDKTVEKNKIKYSGKQWLTICAIASVHLSASICYSVQAPFYPKEAEDRGAKATEYGFVFAIFELTGFVTSPILGRYLHILGPKTTLNVGMIVTGTSMFCFGLLEYVKSHIPFISLSMVLRVAEAIGSTASIVSAYSIIAAVFPDSIATIFAILEGVFGVGILIGPTAGELLFTVGGFKLPFIAIAILVILSDLFIFFVLPPIQKIEGTDGKVNVWDILKIPSVQIVFLCAMVSALSLSFSTSMLEPHTRKFDLTPLLTGLIFVINGGSYAITAPLVGRICDKWLPPRTVLSFSMPMVVVGYIILGPTPHLGIPKTLTSCIIGLVVLGVATAFSLVPTLIDLLASAIKAGYPNDVSTSGVVSGLWFSGFALGSFLGPAISGYLYDLVGFEYGTLFVIAVNLAMFCALMIFIGIEKRAFSCHKQSFDVTI